MNAATLKGMGALARGELRVMLRNKLLGFSALLLPVIMGVALLDVANDLGDGAWGVMAGLQLLLIVILAVYSAGTVAFAARRRELVLKRLRSGELSDAAIVGGEFAPFALLGVLQTAILTVVLIACGAPAPENPLLFAVAALGGIGFGAGAAVATTRFTSSAEVAQLTTMPIFIAAVGGAFWVLSRPPEEVTGAMLLIPGAAVADLARIAWDGVGDPFMPVLAVLVWVVIAVDAGRKWLRWEPRS